MKTSSPALLWLLVALAFSMSAVRGADPVKPAKDDQPQKSQLAKNLFFEKDGDKRRVLIEAYVCLREGQLEQLLTRKNTKEHEAVLAADVDARQIHAALVAAGAKPGSPVKFEPKYQPASGTKIKVTLQYLDQGKTITAPAQEWILNSRTKKDLNQDWVFAGSQFISNRLDPKQPDYYLANDGDVICVSNFESALLDLPIKSPKDNDDLVFEAHAKRIPPKGTKVTVILEPVAEAPK